MKPLVIVILLAVAACSAGPPKLTEPPKNAPVWNLNPDREQGTNNLVQAPTLGDK
jgi:hypothetical protein